MWNDTFLSPLQHPESFPQDSATAGSERQMMGRAGQRQRGSVALSVESCLKPVVSVDSILNLFFPIPRLLSSSSGVCPVWRTSRRIV